MKVLHVLSSHIFSGAENVVCQIIKITKDIPDMQMIYCSPDGTIRPALEERKVKYIPLQKMSVKEVKRVIDEQNPDIVHAHDMKASVISSMACGNTPIVCHIHNNAIDSRKISGKSVAFLLASKKIRHIFWVSKGAYRDYRFRSLIEKKSSILTNIIDKDTLLKRVRDDSTDYNYDVAFVGRMTYPKNPQRFVEIIKILLQEIPNIKAVMMGDGPDLEKLEHFDNIDMLGFVSNPYKIIQEAKVLLMTSDWEGTPMTALEAMALGTPIVSTPVDGMKPLIVDGENGYLSDDNIVLAEKVKEILNNHAERQRMSEFQMKKAKQILDIDKYRNEILTVYGKCSE